MTDAEIISLVELAVKKEMKGMGFLGSLSRPFISQNLATKLIGRIRLEKFMKSGLIDFYKEDFSRFGRVWCRTSDIMKIYNHEKRNKIQSMA